MLQQPITSFTTRYGAANSEVALGVRPSENISALRFAEKSLIDAPGKRAKVWMNEDPNNKMTGEGYNRFPRLTRSFFNSQSQGAAVPVDGFSRSTLNDSEVTPRADKVVQIARILADAQGDSLGSTLSKR
jgi:hypothetical protein